MPSTSRGTILRVHYLYGYLICSRYTPATQTYTMKHIFLPVLLLTGSLCLAQSGISTEEVVSVGGIRQFITINAKDTASPVLLFLHGGPGGSVMRYANKFTGQLRDHFIVVQWDQRETGKTLDLNPSPVPLSFELFQNDTRELIGILLERFRKEKLYLVGHSWGTALGFEMTRRYPGLLYAFVCVGPMINQLESERIALSLMKKKALKNGNQNAIAELDLVEVPFANGEQLYYHRKWLADYSGSRKRPDEHHVRQWAETWLSVFNEASQVNLFKSLPAVACPVYFFAGTRDLQTNSSIAEKYFQSVKASRKAFYWFDTGHSIPSTAPGRFQDLLIQTVLPETYNHSAF